MSEIIKRIETDPSTGKDIRITEEVELDEEGRVDKVLEIIDIEPV